MLPCWKLLISQAPGATAPERGGGLEWGAQASVRPARPAWRVLWLVYNHTARGRGSETAEVAKNTQSGAQGRSAPAVVWGCQHSLSGGGGVGALPTLGTGGLCRASGWWRPREGGGRSHSKAEEAVSNPAVPGFV